MVLRPTLIFLSLSPSSPTQQTKWGIQCKKIKKMRPFTLIPGEIFSVGQVGSPDLETNFGHCLPHCSLGLTLPFWHLHFSQISAKVIPKASDSCIKISGTTGHVKETSAGSPGHEKEPF